ncbi:MAG: hypothetical protein C0508_03110 [Cyanobacteria bacterium PR.023]|jgi:tetratricopeptide (TPR) repeat protein|nr:hypothetical protein [Cyanobacteria bacterium PR.3.49]MBA4074002.1 hypothetical protein [Cyanobacteria bacterium PR.023]
MSLKKKCLATVVVVSVAVFVVSCSSNSSSTQSGTSKNSAEDAEKEKIASELFNKHMEAERVKNYPAALDIANQLIKVQPSFGYKLRAETYMRTGKYEEAEKDIKEAMRLDPDNGSMFDYGAIIATHLKHYDDAISRSEEAIKKNHSDLKIEVYKFIAIAYQAKKDDKKAIEYLTKSISQIDGPEERYLRGAAYDSVGMSEEALADFSSAIQWDPMLMSAYKRRAVIYSRLGQKGKENAELAAAKQNAKKGLARADIDWIPLDLSAQEMKVVEKNPRASFTR